MRDIDSSSSSSFLLYGASVDHHQLTSQYVTHKPLYSRRVFKEVAYCGCCFSFFLMSSLRERVTCFQVVILCSSSFRTMTKELKRKKKKRRRGRRRWVVEGVSEARELVVLYNFKQWAHFHRKCVFWARDQKRRIIFLKAPRQKWVGCTYTHTPTVGWGKEKEEERRDEGEDEEKEKREKRETSIYTPILHGFNR